VISKLCGGAQKILVGVLLCIVLARV